MISSLLQTNRDFSKEDLARQDTLRNAKPKQLKLDSAFRPVKTKRTVLSRATLIVAPASLLDQWCTELQRSSEKGALNVLVWHGQNRDDLESMIDTTDESDVIITSYGTLAAEHARVGKTSKSVALFDSKSIWLSLVP